MQYIIIGIFAILAGIQAFGIRRRHLNQGAASSSPMIHRPVFLVTLGWIGITLGLFLILTGAALVLTDS
ncbi:hypothetical protein ABZV34_27450 [Streptomyces sp. NPDC005195]|uniref:hypothetical protein n=1 Tax=Streptomyces sp. NPDC005195 TaxID=3154561 RepID=UPI0033ACB033